MWLGAFRHGGVFFPSPQGHGPPESIDVLGDVFVFGQSEAAAFPRLRRRIQLQIDLLVLHLVIVGVGTTVGVGRRRVGRNLTVAATAIFRLKTGVNVTR